MTAQQRQQPQSPQQPQPTQPPQPQPAVAAKPDVTPAVVAGRGPVQPTPVVVVTPQDDILKPREPASRAPVDQGTWGSEPLIEVPVPYNPVAPGDYIVRWKAYFRTNQEAFQAYLTANPTLDPNWALMTRDAYLAALPFPGER